MEKRTQTMVSCGVLRSPHCSPLTLLHACCRRLLTEEQKRLYTKVAQYCNRSTDLIPMSFVLGMGPSPASLLWGCPHCPSWLGAGGVLGVTLSSWSHSCPRGYQWDVHPPTPTHPTMPTDHVSQCHILWVLEHLQGW